MRIISGKHKGRSIEIPSNFKGRPTTDFARQGLFNSLYNMIDIDGLAVLELFAGTGAFALECHSRGAGSIVCVDTEALHLKHIAANFKKFEVKNGSTYRSDAFEFIARNKGHYDLIFADPPFDLPGLEKLPEAIFRKNIMAEKGIFILEHSRHFDFSGHPCFITEKKYSNVHFSFFGND